MPKNEKVKIKERVEDNICDLSLSGLDEVPVREIATFKRVTVLDLSSNRLISLGRNFPSLTRLVKLDLSKNQIKYLPDDFGLLRNLRHLDLYDNQLEHLPLSFGNLVSLRYLDLKGNQLMPALAKIVGFCLTSKECQDSARNTVKFLAHMQTEAAKVQEQIQQDMHNQNEQTEKEQAKDEAKTIENQKLQKSKKTSKSKNKKAINHIEAVDVVRKKPNNKIAKAKKAAGGPLKITTPNSTAALTSILTFFLLLAINVIIIYMIMFKNPEIAEKLVEFIPHSYRDWILTKTEIFRLHVTDWITEFRTPPEEH